MNLEKKSAYLVAQGIALDREIADREAKLKLIKEQLVDLAKVDGDGHTPTDNGGWSWIVSDEIGNIARVTMPARSLKSELPLESELTDKVRALIPTLQFKNLFVLASHYELAKDFRGLSVEILEKPIANRLLKLVTSSPRAKVSFEIKEVA